MESAMGSSISTIVNHENNTNMTPKKPLHFQPNESEVGPLPLHPKVLHAYTCQSPLIQLTGLKLKMHSYKSSFMKKGKGCLVIPQ